MRKLSILGVLLALVFSGCSSDSNTSHANIVQGQWKLINVSGSFTGASSDFEPGLITWDFNPTTQTVTVVNNNTDDSLNDIFETGVYNYSVVANPNPETCSQTLKIDDYEMGCFSIVEGNLQIDQSFVDGFTVTLAP
jgi:hypothetical protein